MNKHAQALTRPLTCCRLRGPVQVCRGGVIRFRRVTLMGAPPASVARIRARQTPVEHTKSQL